MKKKLMKIVDILKKNINADDWTISVSFTDDRHTRFAQNAVTQHINGNKINVEYQCIKDKKIGSASTCQLDKDNLLKMLQKAENIARYSSPDEQVELSLEKSEYPEIDNFVEETSKFTINETISRIKQPIDFAKSENAHLSGIFSKTISEQIFCTGRGFTGYNKFSNFDYSMTIRKDHRETKISTGNKDIEKFDISSLTDAIKSQFHALKKMKTMESESIPVILRPQAVLQLFWYLAWLFDRQSADEGLTPFTNSIGKKFFGEKFNLVSKIDDKDLLCYPFSSNSVHKNITWVDKGVVKNIPTNRKWAQKNNLSPSTIFNVIFTGDNKSEEEMMKMVPRGLIINNLWYIRLNDRKTLDLTGMTRDGVLYFENGEVKNAVNNFRFNEKLHELTHRILATGKTLQVDSTAKVPTILVDDFNFVDKTNF